MGIERSLPNRISRVETAVENIRYDLDRLIESCDDEDTRAEVDGALVALRTVAGHLAEALGKSEVAARGGRPQSHPLTDALAARSA